MKKTLLSFAVLGALAGSAAAADVTLYGLVDYGFNYQHLDSDVAGADAQDNFEMRSGMNSGSRFGLKGAEDLGNGYKVGFVLENGFNADDGKLGNGGRLFGREAQLYVQGGWGTLSFGRVGQLASANGTYGLLGRFSPFSSGWGDTVGQRTVFSNGFDRFDNTVTYASPDFAGVKVFAQYSFKNDSSADGDENKPTANRYYGIGATFDYGNFAAVAVVDSINLGNNGYYANYDQLDDTLTATVGATYDFGVVKLFGTAQYFDNAREVGYFNALGGVQSYNNTWGYGTQVANDGRKFGSNMEGYGIALGASAPLFGGTVAGLIGYMDADNNGGSKDATAPESSFDISRWNIAVGYSYNLSKRTSVYTAAAYTKDDVQVTGTGNQNCYDGDPSSVEVMAGMIHRF